MTDYEILCAVFDVQKRGLAKGKLQDANGHCVRGSIIAVVNNDHKDLTRIENIIKAANGWSEQTQVTSMNDLPSTTLDTVLGWLRNAAAFVAPRIPEGEGMMPRTYRPHWWSRPVLVDAHEFTLVE